MSVDMALYRTEDASNVCHKKLGASLFRTEINVRKKDDITNFTVIIQSDKDLISSGTNYCRLYKPIDRYYFVNTIETVSPTMFRLELLVDVVNTYLSINNPISELVTISSTQVIKSTIDSNGGLVEGESSFVLVTLGSEEAIP